jgi:hypothetical protein
MKNILFFVLASMIVVGVVNAQGKKSTMKAEKFTGYLVDGMCATSMVKMGPAKAMEKAKRHKRECNFHEGCAASGFGLMFEGTFHPFDTAGNTKAMSYLKSITQDNSIEVTVTGTMEGAIISVKKIQAK